MRADVSNPEVAKNVAAVLEMSTSVPEGKIKVSVKDGRVTLSGEVDRAFQQAAAEKAIKNNKDVSGINNQIVLTGRVTTPEVKSKIESALLPNVLLDARRIKVENDGQVVKLTGNVHSCSGRRPSMPRSRLPACSR